MNIAIILAGGSGTRLKSSNIPKQFIEIKNKPIFIHTIDKFINNLNIDKVIVCCKKDWINRAIDYVKKYFNDEKENIYIIEGGNSRNDSILKGIQFIKKNLNPKKNDVILTHDSVRMFVNSKIINDNIIESKNNDLIIDTCVKAIDTIVHSTSGDIINDIPNRDYYYNGQTPQSGKFFLIDKIYSKKYTSEIFNSTDLCKLAEISGIPIKIVEGDYFNIKITSEYELFIANLLEGKNE